MVATIRIISILGNSSHLEPLKPMLRESRASGIETLTTNLQKTQDKNYYIAG